MDITADEIADMDPTDGANITAVRMRADREGHGLITVPFPHVCTSDDNVLDIANHRAMLAEIPDSHGREPYGYSSAWLTFPATGDRIRTYIECVSYVLREYPILDDSLHSELEYDDACEQWDSWGQSDAYRDADVSAYSDADNAADAIDELRAAEYLIGTDTPIADDIDAAAFVGFTADGFYSDSLSYDSAARAIEERVAAWHALRAHNLATCNGAQIVLDLA